MIKFFRKIRQNLLTENKTRKYLKYAIGEIILVVIGILIALSINNWNETKKERSKLNDVLGIVKSDLIKDTLNISQPIKYFEEKNTLLSKIIKRKYSKSSLDSITESNYENSDYLGNAITSYDVFYMQNKGIKLLKEISINSDFEKDTLITNIVDIHSVFANYFKMDIELQLKLAFDNIEEHSKYSWFIDDINRENNREMYEYFYSDKFKGQAARSRIYSKEFLRDLKTYDSIAKSYISVIEKRLEKK